MKTLERLPNSAPKGTRVLVSLDEHVIAETVTRSAPWPIHDGPNAPWVVLLDGRAGGYSVDRCFVFPTFVPPPKLTEAFPGIDQCS